MHRIFLKYFTVFAVGALVYGFLEVAGRGYTHISMGILGGLSMVAIHISNDARREGLNYFIQIGIITLFITSIEFITGEILNLRLGMNIWDYSELPLNIDGQICLPFVVLWAVLSAIGIAFDDFLRWKMFRDDKDFDYLRRSVYKENAI